MVLAWCSEDSSWTSTRASPGSASCGMAFGIGTSSPNLPESWSPEEILDRTYQRCDQENLIAGLGTGIAAWRMPVAEMRGNAAWLEIARLAWNLGKWIAQLDLPEEVSRWEWKRFRRAFVDLPAQLVRIARQTRVRILGTHRFAELFMEAHAVLQV